LEGHVAFEDEDEVHRLGCVPALGVDEVLVLGSPDQIAGFKAGLRK